MDDGKRLDHAVVLFHNRQYAKAIAIYNQLEESFTSLGPSLIKQLRKDANAYLIPTIEPIHPNLPQVWDNRTACYEKLGQLDRAINDAKTLTTRDPLSCKGWIRLGKLYRQTGDPQLATETFRTGLDTVKEAFKQHKVKPPPKLYQLLKSLWESGSVPQKRAQTEDTKEVKKQRRVIDPMMVFPLELVEEIFSHFPTANILKLHLVSKLWYHSLKQLRSLYYFQCHRRVTPNQFIHGLNLMRQIGGEIRHLRVMGAENIARVLRCVTECTVRFQKIELSDRHMSWSLWLQIIAKSGWKLASFRRVKFLSLGSICSLAYPNTILSVFPELTSFRSIIYDRGADKLAAEVPVGDSWFRRLNNPNHSILIHDMVLVNHPKLNRDQGSGPVAPPFLTLAFTHLTQLTIANYDMEAVVEDIGKFLLTASALKRMTWENNSGLSLYDFLQIVQNYQPNFELDELTFRERHVHQPTSLLEFRQGDLRPLHHLQHLDVYGSSLTTHGLKRLLELVGKTVTRLEIGASGNIQWPRDVIGRQGSVLKWPTLFRLVPCLEKLGVANSQLDQYSLTQLARLSPPHPLTFLDLSFCVNVNGTGLLTLYEYPVARIRIDGVEIDHSTLAYLTEKNPNLDSISGDPRQSRMFRFGVDTWIQPE